MNGVTTAYGYGDTNWKDKLTSYDGQSITYDAIGNPLSYRGMTMSWTGRRLNSITNSGVSNSYLYDANGIRIRKTIGSTVTEYFTNGSTILAEKTGSNILWYIYDSDGEILGFTYNGTPYYYIKNVQGDVYKVVNASGSVVASYTYDAWGKVTASSGAMADINPVRYRSYYYDKETNLYYLQSRYYDPETGRFINADGLFSSGITTTNMFSYCCNNPIVSADESGHYAYNKMLRTTDSGFSLLKWSNFLPSVLNRDVSAGTLISGFAVKLGRSIGAALSAITVEAGIGVGVELSGSTKVNSVTVGGAIGGKCDFVHLSFDKGNFDIGMQCAASLEICLGVSLFSLSAVADHSFATSSPDCKCDFWEGVSPNEMIACPATRITRDGIACSPFSISIGGYAIYGASASLTWDIGYFMNQLTIIWSE